MTTASASITIPKTFGGSNLSELFGRISLSTEVKEFLAALDARLLASFSSGAEKPELLILDRTNKPVCSIDEFSKLGGFRRWVNDELKALEKESTNSVRVNLTALFFRKASEKKMPLPDRIEASNETKFRQFHSMVEIISTNLESIEETVDSTFRTYFLEKGAMLVNVIYKLMLWCLKPEKLEKEVLNDDLFSCGIPKWIFKKLVDKNFTNNLKADAVSLLFPKGNYLKSIALTTREMNDESFLTMNQEILVNSGAIIALAKSDWMSLFPHVPKEMGEDVEKFYGEYEWVLNNPYSAEEILETRASGKSPPTFKGRQKENPKPGSKKRPESETQKICREIYNTLGEMEATFLHFQNFVIPMADPLENFWSKVLTGTDAWEITPTHGLYDHIKEAQVLDKLETIRNLSNPALLLMFAEAMCQALRLPLASGSGKQIVSVVKAMSNKAGYVKLAKPFTIDAKKFDVHVPTMEKVEVPEEITEQTKKFLGLTSSKKSQKKKRGGLTAVRLHTQVLNELEIIRSSKIYEKAKEWIATTFKTGNRVLTQTVAAQRIVGEVLKYQDQLLEEDFEEFDVMQDAEEYDED
jgi:hypothetical protein